MKIEITVEEINEFRKLINASNEIQKRFIKAIDGYDTEIPEVHILDLVEAINKSKMCKVSLGLHGFVIEINPEYIVDFLTVYNKCIVACGNAVVALVSSFKELEGDVEVFTDKWL